MLERIKKWLRMGSLERGDHTSAFDRPVENIDVLAASGMRDADPNNPAGVSYPPGYVKAYDEGRPKK